MTLLVLLAGAAVVVVVLLGLLFKPGPIEQWVAARPRKQGDNHWLHFLMTVGTCGLWFPVWVICACRAPRRR